MKKILITGNEACGEGAIKAGCRFYAGYPITPQNELTAYMSKRMDEKNGIFIQAESELAAINMIFGASLTGRRAMTTSSSPGISLKQEGISYLAGCQLPVVIVNIMRGGPGLGNISPSQADYFQATKGGGHGDYNMAVLAPASVQEMYDFTLEAFNIADRYRNPVMILGDGMLGQMMEPIEIVHGPQSIVNRKKDWVLDGCKGRKPRIIKSLFLREGELEDRNKELQKKYDKIRRNEIRFERYKTDNAKLILIAYGTSARIARASVDELRKKGKLAGLFRPISLWPFPYNKLKKLDKGRTRFLVVEMSAGQMVEDVKLAIEDSERIYFHGRMGGGVPEQSDIVRLANRILK
ncbi:MAG: 3-methyl-2-oxobutanoate dehydrogenase subunit VorB [Candidatus Omnitrophica bacterium]|nr:3-methyl-2-oxobutanoate dehydrogenase subunit VorB [Candidatus Omnitrophota bacterium]